MELVPPSDKSVFNCQFLSDPSPINALPCQPSVLVVNFAEVEFTQPFFADVQLNCWICQSCYKDLLKFLHGCVRVREGLNGKKKLFFSIEAFPYSMFFSPFAKQNQAEV